MTNFRSRLGRAKIGKVFNFSISCSITANSVLSISKDFGFPFFSFAFSFAAFFEKLGTTRWYTLHKPRNELLHLFVGGLKSLTASVVLLELPVFRVV